VAATARRDVGRADASPAPETLDPVGSALIDDRAVRRRVWRTAADIFRDRFRVPERLTVTEWADKYRWLPETSANPGKYESSLAPYQREPMDMLGEAPLRGVRLVVLMWASQVGKSLVLENAIGWQIHLKPRPIIVVQPKIDSAEAWSKERFTPMVKATPVLRERIEEGRGRGAENTLRFQQFPGGFAAIASANSPAELAARSCARGYCDEVDRYQVTDEGWAPDIVERRMGAIDDAVQALTSTPGDKGASLIEPAFLAGDQRYYLVPCPHCGHRQRLVFGTATSPGGLKWERGVPGSVWYRCEANGCRIEEKHKPWMLEQGDWVATNAAGLYPSYHLNALYSPFGGTTWAIIVGMWEKAQGLRDKMKVFVNTILAETWEEPGEVIEANTLLSRLEDYPEAHLPDGIRVLSAGADVQDNRIEYFVWGWGRGEEAWLIRHEVLVGDTDSDEPWTELDRVWREEYVSADGEALRVKRLFVDAGFRSNRVYTWCRMRHRHGVYACKGIGGEGVPFLGKASIVGDARCLHYPVGVDAAKTSFLRSRLYVVRPDPPNADGSCPRYVHLPNAEWMTVELLEQLTSEKRVKRLVGGRIVTEWVPLRERNEALDCQNYAHAALHSLGVPRLLSSGIIDGAKATVPRAAHEDDDEPPDAPGGVRPPSAPPPRPPAPPPGARSSVRPRTGGYVRAGLRR